MNVSKVPNKVPAVVFSVFLLYNIWCVYCVYFFFGLDMVMCACLCLCVCRRFTGNNAGQNIPMRNNKRCLRSMSECPRISAVRPVREQRAWTGQPIFNSHVFYLHLNPAIVFWAAVVKHITKNSSWEILEQSKQPLAARCSKYEPVEVFFYQTSSFYFFEHRGLLQFPLKKKHKIEVALNILGEALGSDCYTFQMCTV